MSAVPFAIELDVRYFDVDERRVVNNARYLNYFEEVRMALLDQMRQQFEAEFRGRVIVARAECDYLKSLILRDRVRAEAGIQRIGNKSFDVGYRLFNQHGDPVARGLTTQVHFDYEQGTSLPLTEAQRKALTHFQWRD